MQSLRENFYENVKKVVDKVILLCYNNAIKEVVNMTISKLAEIMARTELIRGEYNVQREDIDNDFLSLANGYKACGGDVYITQTYDLRSVRFNAEERNETYWFFSWAMSVIN